MSKHDKPDPEEVPARFTGGVDYTSAPDVSDPAALADYIARINAATPDVIQTNAGALVGTATDVEGLDIAVGDMPGQREHDQESRDIKAGLRDVRTAYDGTPVRVLPASEFRARRFLLAPGASAIVAERDIKRTSLTVWITDPSNGVTAAYVGNERANVIAQGAELVTGRVGPYGIELNNGDRVAIAAYAGNANAITVNATWEVLP